MKDEKLTFSYVFGVLLGGLCILGVGLGVFGLIALVVNNFIL